MSKHDAVIDRCADVARAVESRFIDEVAESRERRDVCGMTFAEHARCVAGQIAEAILALKEEK